MNSLFVLEINGEDVTPYGVHVPGEACSRCREEQGGEESGRGADPVVDRCVSRWQELYKTVLQLPEQVAFRRLGLDDARTEIVIIVLCTRGSFLTGLFLIPSPKQTFECPVANSKQDGETQADQVQHPDHSLCGFGVPDFWVLQHDHWQHLGTTNLCVRTRSAYLVY